MARIRDSKPRCMAIIQGRWTPCYLFSDDGPSDVVTQAMVRRWRKRGLGKEKMRLGPYYSVVVNSSEARKMTRPGWHLVHGCQVMMENDRKPLAEDPWAEKRKKRKGERSGKARKAPPPPPRKAPRQAPPPPRKAARKAPPPPRRTPKRAPPPPPRKSRSS